MQTVDHVTQDMDIKSRDAKSLTRMSVASSWAEELRRGVQEYCVHR